MKPTGIDFRNVTNKRSYPYWLTEAQAAHYFKISGREFKSMVAAGLMPPGVKDSVIDRYNTRWSRCEIERCWKKFQNELLERLAG